MIANKYHIGDYVFYKYPKKENTVTGYVQYTGTILTIGDNFGSVYYEILRDTSTSKNIDTINQKDIIEVLKPFNTKKRKPGTRGLDKDSIYIGMKDSDIGEDDSSIDNGNNCKCC